MTSRLASTTLMLAALWASGCGSSQDMDTRIGLAITSIERGEYNAASLELTNALQTNPDHREARILLARVAVASGRAAAAERQLHNAELLGASTRDVLPHLGQALIAQGKFEELLRVANIDSTDPEVAATAATLTGIAHLHLRRPARAERAFRDALVLSPRKVEAQVGLANVAFARGDLVTAHRRLIETTRNAPLSVLAHQALGALHFSQRHYLEAERAFSDAIGLPASLAESSELLLAHVGLIEAQWQVGKRSKAILNAKDLLQNYPWHPLPRYLRALLAYSDGDYQLANEYLDSVLRVAPDHGPSRQLTAAANFSQGNLGRAQMHLTRFLQETPEDPDMLRLLGETYLHMGNPHQALAVMTPSYGDPYLDTEALTLYATVHGYAGNRNEAVDFFSAAADRRPGDIVLQTRLAASLLNAGQRDSADQIMSAWPTTQVTEHARTLLRLLRFLRADDPERASSYAKRRRRDDPSDLHALLALAETAEASGNRDQSVAWLEIARDRNPGRVEPRLLLCNYAQRAGDYAALQALAEETLAVQPYNRLALSFLGESQLAQRNNGLALATFQEALRVAPDLVDNAFNLARAQFAIGDFWSGKATLIDAIEKHPEALSEMLAVIVEEHQRGNEEQARSLARHFKSRFGQHAAAIEIAGDLAMLQGDFAQAASDYERTFELRPSREIALKIFSATLSAKTGDPAAPLTAWLEKNPADAQFTRIVRTLNGGASLPR